MSLAAAPAHKRPQLPENSCPLNGIGSSSAPLILFGVYRVPRDKELPEKPCPLNEIGSSSAPLILFGALPCAEGQRGLREYRRPLGHDLFGESSPCNNTIVHKLFIGTEQSLHSIPSSLAPSRRKFLPFQRASRPHRNPFQEGNVLILPHKSAPRVHFSQLVAPFMAYFAKPFRQAQRFPFEEDISNVKCRLCLQHQSPAHKDRRCHKTLAH
ncbi:hypothetical protein CDAR_38611 [Caerostris darwini]|uniref:Uncharacterized protein n=1 Tax=Caerostris darwini TaxID=1538125 RepID=A0AAV4UQM5_9ARAC|nr:hypothetical protein CDAR_38611 [Caerostris darwini]